MVWIASYLPFQSLGRSGTVADTSGVGMVEITASARIIPSGICTPVTHFPSERLRTAGVESRAAAKDSDRGAERIDKRLASALYITK
jgi:hypothetical protein